MVKAMHPYLNFNGNTEEAFRYYQTVFGGELRIVRFSDFPDNPMNVPGEDLDKIANVSLPIANGTVMMASDSLASMGNKAAAGSNFAITVDPETAEEAERLFAALSDGGSVYMPLSATQWAEKYGLCTDRFGIRWMINYQGDVDFDLGHTE
jgi:PhnB protein